MVAIGIFCHNSSNFDEKQYISVETLSATSKFDEYSDFKPRCSSCRRMALSYTCFKQERNIKDTTETSTVTTETTTVTTETPSVATNQNSEERCSCRLQIFFNLMANKKITKNKSLLIDSH